MFLRSHPCQSLSATVSSCQCLSVCQPLTVPAMWAVFCSLNSGSLPAGWRKILKVGPLTLAHGDPDAPAGEPGHRGPERPCRCCYYTMSQPLEDPEHRTCGWFIQDPDHWGSWTWWHGDAPHAPYPYPDQQPAEEPAEEPAAAKEPAEEPANPGDMNEECIMSLKTLAKPA